MTFDYQLSGMEVAAYLSDKADSVTVIGSSKFPFQSSLGPDIGKMTMQVREHCGIFLFFLFTAKHHQSQVINLLLKMLEEKNVKFYTSNGVAEIRGENGKVRSSILLHY